MSIAGAQAHCDRQAEADLADATGPLAGSSSEEWRDIPGWGGRYQVSNKGRVQSLRGGQRRAPLLAPGRGSDYGHLKVTLGAERVGMWVHRAVLLAFVGPPTPGQVARHLDGDPSNNHLSNLAWGTAAENSADTVTHGRTTRGAKNSRVKLTEGDVREIRSLIGVLSGKDIAAQFGISPATVSNIKSGQLWGWLDA